MGLFFLPRIGSLHCGDCPKTFKKAIYEGVEQKMQKIVNLGNLGIEVRLVNMVYCNNKQ